MENVQDSAGVCHYSIAGFIDLLGTKERIAYIEAGETPEEQCQRLGEALQNVRKFRDDFEATRRGWLEVETANDLLCPEDLRPLRDSLKGNPTEIHSFSDTVIIHASLAATNRKVPLESVWTILAATAAAQLHTLARGVPARGGIDIGLAADVVAGEIFGPAAYRALVLEEQLADWPRVVLGGELLAYIDGYGSIAPRSAENEMNRNYANRCKNLVCMDSTGAAMLDVCSTSLACLMPDDLHRRCIEKARACAEERTIQYRTQGKTRLAGMYAVLSEYLHNG